MYDILALLVGVWLLLGSVGEAFLKFCCSFCREIVWGAGGGVVRDL